MTTHDGPAIDVRGLRKAYGELVAVDGIDLEAHAGSIFGLLGPNGAGKSTAIGCISGLLPPTDGMVRVEGHDVVREGRAARARMGVVPQELALYEDLSARDNLAYWGGAYGLRGGALRTRVDAVLDRIGLADRAREPVRRFSGGMKRRLNFGCGVVHRPKVLLLDEPTVAVDPQSRVRLLELVREEVAQGTCVLYTTHHMEEAEELCDRIAVIDHGHIIATGSLAELRGMMGERDLVRLTGRFDPGAVEAALSKEEDLELVSVAEDVIVLALASASRRLPILFAALGATGAELRETTVTQPSLESLFIKLTGKELRE